MTIRNNRALIFLLYHYYRAGSPPKVCSLVSTCGGAEDEYIGAFKGDKGKENGNCYSVYWGYLEVILGFYRDYMGIKEKKMETTIQYIGEILG